MRPQHGLQRIRELLMSREAGSADVELYEAVLGSLESIAEEIEQQADMLEEQQEIIDELSDMMDDGPVFQKQGPEDDENDSTLEGCFSTADCTSCGHRVFYQPGVLSEETGQQLQCPSCGEKFDLV